MLTLLLACHGTGGAPPGARDYLGWPLPQVDPLEGTVHTLRQNVAVCGEADHGPSDVMFELRTLVVGNQRYLLDLSIEHVSPTFGVDVQLPDDAGKQVPVGEVELLLQCAYEPNISPLSPRHRYVDRIGVSANGLRHPF